MLMVGELAVCAPNVDSKLKPTCCVHGVSGSDIDDVTVFMPGRKSVGSEELNDRTLVTGSLHCSPGGSGGEDLR